LTTSPPDESRSEQPASHPAHAGGDHPAPVISASGAKKKVLGLLISLGILAALYSQLDLAGVGKALIGANPLWLVIGLSVTIPVTLLLALRFAWIAPRGALSGYWESVRLLLVAQVLNLFLPAKLGDLAKSYFVIKGGNSSGGLAVSLVVFERVCDMFGLTTWCLLGSALRGSEMGAVSWTAAAVIAGLWCVAGLLIASRGSAAFALDLLGRLLPARLGGKVHGLSLGWLELHDALGRQKGGIVLFCIGLWFLMLSQIWLFTLAVRAPVPFWVCLPLASLAIFAGQVPYAFAGMGVRDVAFIVLFKAYIGAEAAAAIGVLTTVRALLPCLVAILVVRPYMSMVIDEIAAWRSRI
jgi:uncharacterized membrane protein YbhN (UPF0104 family)